MHSWKNKQLFLLGFQNELRITGARHIGGSVRRETVIRTLTEFYTERRLSLCRPHAGPHMPQDRGPDLLLNLLRGA